MSESAPEKPTVLLVEDDHVLRAIVRMLLTRRGCRVLEAENGEAAMALLKDTAPDIIVTDLLMPVMDGFSLVDIVRKTERLAHLPIIVMTAADDREKREWATALGVNRIISKPVEPGSFFDSLAPYFPKRPEGHA